jgi:ligand-binding SRPBCC domain-containing protein
VRDVAEASVSPLHTLVRAQNLARPVDDVFAFFADAANLEAITPPALGFRILTPLPVGMASGTLIDYRLRLFGIPFRWRTRIEVFEPGVRFVDVQLSGPYRLWRHSHVFVPLGRGTLVVDAVVYELPLGALGAAAHALFVRRTLEHIFDHRRQRIAALLGGEVRHG